MIVGPQRAGGGGANNTTSLSFRPTVVIPAGATTFVTVVTNLPDGADLAVTDAVGNVYDMQVSNVMQPGTTTNMWVFICAQSAAQLGTNQNIVATPSIRCNAFGGAVFYTGAIGHARSVTAQWDSVVNPVINGVARVGDQLLALMAVGGSVNEQFTQDPAWSSDLFQGVGNQNYAMHAGSMVSQVDGQIVYAPTLAGPRSSVSMLASFN